MDRNLVRQRLAAEWERLLETEAAIAQQGLAAGIGDEHRAPAPAEQDLADAGNEVLARELEASVRGQVEADLQAIRDAYRRLELGTYGRCGTCGERIDDERLAAVPATRFCLAHERQWELDTLSLAEPEEGGEDDATAAEHIAEREAIAHFEFVPDEEEPEEVDLAAEEAALHLEVARGGERRGLALADLQDLEREAGS